jgi:RNA polymerase sigma-70 factor (ECF subfamily)
VTQEAFFKAYRALDRFREEASLATWFYRIVIRQAHDFCRWRAVRQTWNDFWSGRASETVAQEPGDPLLRRRIARALAQLSRSQREAFVLVHLEGFSVREAATVMAKPEGTVKSHLHRALQTLRSELADLAENTGGSPL